MLKLVYQLAINDLQLRRKLPSTHLHQKSNLNLKHLNLDLKHLNLKHLYLKFCT